MDILAAEAIATVRRHSLCPSAPARLVFAVGSPVQRTALLQPHSFQRRRVLPLHPWASRARRGSTPFSLPLFNLHETSRPGRHLVLQDGDGELVGSQISYFLVNIYLPRTPAINNPTRKSNAVVVAGRRSGTRNLFSAGSVASCHVCCSGWLFVAAAAAAAAALLSRVSACFWHVRRHQGPGKCV